MVPQNSLWTLLVANAGMVDVPEAQQVVVAARRQLASIRAPLQATDFLGVALILRDKADWHSNVVVDDCSIH